MRLQGSKAIHYDSGPNMTPLVDVVMVILIFLMLAGTFSAAHFLPTGTIRPPTIPGVGRVAQVRPQLDLYVSSVTGGGFSVRIGGSSLQYDAASLKQALETRLQEHLAAGSPHDRLELVIHPRLATWHADLITVYELAMDAQWPRINFASARD